QAFNASLKDFAIRARLVGGLRHSAANLPDHLQNLEYRFTQKSVNAYLKRWLDTKLKPNYVGLATIDLGGSGHFVKEYAMQARDHLAAASLTGTIGVIGLLDFYGCPTAALDARLMEKEVDDKRFRMFYAVHESEAWLLSQPEIMPWAISDALPNGRSRFRKQ
ncbi:MAG TPA: hypothetical protein VHX65_08495, partial [Pirellulales bacterium]|nr:hypothetical protein [Pirellulales bacterium]